MLGRLSPPNSMKHASFTLLTDLPLPASDQVTVSDSDRLSEKSKQWMHSEQYKCVNVNTFHTVYFLMSHINIFNGSL